MCDQGLSHIFSDEFLYDNDSKRALEKVFHHEPKASGENLLLTLDILDS